MNNSLVRRMVTSTRNSRFDWTEPRCYAPQVDATFASRAYGRLALPKLARELSSPDKQIVRQSVTSLVDISANPEEAMRIVELRIHEKIADSLISEDPYLRERSAMIYGTLSRRASGREAIANHPDILRRISTGLVDNLSIVRIKMARVIENLARNPIAAEDLCERGFIERLVDVIGFEKNTTILEVHLESIGCLLNNGTTNVNVRAIEINAMEKLVSLLDKRNEGVICRCLECLSRLCQETMGKEKSIEMDLLSILQKFLNDERRAVCGKAASVIVFATITARGRFRAFELNMIDRLVELAADTKDRELQLVSIQSLANIAELPDGKRKILNEYSTFIADIDTCKDEATEKYKNILMKIIYSTS